MSLFLAIHYKRGDIPSEYELMNYLKSKKYNRKMKKISSYIYTKEKIKEKKFRFIFKIMFNPFFYINLKEHYILIKRVK